MGAADILSTSSFAFWRTTALEGQCIAYLLPWAQLEAELPKLKALLIGRDPHEVEANLLSVDRPPAGARPRVESHRHLSFGTFWASITASRCTS